MKKYYEPLVVTVEDSDELISNGKSYKLEVLDSQNEHIFKITQGDNVVLVDGLFTFEKMQRYVHRNFIAPNEYDNNGKWLYKREKSAIERGIEIDIPINMSLNLFNSFEGLYCWLREAGKIDASGEFVPGLSLLERLEMSGLAINMIDRIVGLNEVSGPRVSTNKTFCHIQRLFEMTTTFYFRERKSFKTYVVKHTTEIDQSDLNV